MGPQSRGEPLVMMVSPLIGRSRADAGAGDPCRAGRCLASARLRRDPGRARPFRCRGAKARPELTTPLPEEERQMTLSEVRRASNYGYQVNRMRALDARNGQRKPIWNFVELGWPWSETAAQGSTRFAGAAVDPQPGRGPLRAGRLRGAGPPGAVEGGPRDRRGGAPGPVCGGRRGTSVARSLRPSREPSGPPSGRLVPAARRRPLAARVERRRPWNRSIEPRWSAFMRRASVRGRCRSCWWATLRRTGPSKRP